MVCKGRNTVKWEIFTSINFREWPTRPAKNFMIFIFATKSWCLPHPLQFPTWKWWPTVCIVETIVRFPRLLKHVGRCQRKTAMPKGGSKLRRCIRSCSELIVGREKFPQFAWCFYDKIGQPFVDLLDRGLKALHVLDYGLTHCQQEICGGKNFHGNKFSRAGVWSRKSRKFLLRKNSPLYGK